MSANFTLSSDLPSQSNFRQIGFSFQKVWDSETDNPVDRPNFARIVKEANNNIRESLMRLETEIMSA